MPKRQQIEDTIDAVYSLIEQKNDTLLDTTYQRLCGEFNEIKDIKNDPYIIYVQFKAMACVVRANIYAKNSDAITYEMQMLYALDRINIKEDIINRAQLLKILKLVYEVADDCNEFCKSCGFKIPYSDVVKSYGKTRRKYEEIKHETEKKHNCYLCNEREGSFKGSHLAPNFLIQPFLTSGNIVKRDKEIVTEISFNENKKDRKWGRSVSPEEVREQFGDVPDEELVKMKSHALTRDFFFCHDCENRFGYLETTYATYFSDKKNTVNPIISYLFWLSVFWRLSKANMCLKMSDDDENFIRKILDESIPYSFKETKELNSINQPMTYCYTIIHCVDTKSERNVILGGHQQHSPYSLVIGPYIITLYKNQEDAKDVPYPLNDFTHQEKIVDVNFLEYWMIKQKIMNEIQYMKLLNADKKGAVITDIAYGGYNTDDLEKVFYPAGKNEYNNEKKDIINKGTKYAMVIPGALVKVLSYQQKHPFDSVDEFWEGFEKQYKYTKDEIEAIANVTLGKNFIRRFQTDDSKKRHQRRKQNSKAKQKRNRKRH